MPFLQSLFCWIGLDNRYRFSLIVSLSHLFFIIFSAIFQSSLVMSIIILLISTFVITCTTKRRLADGKLTKSWLYIPTLTFAILGFIIIALSHQSLYWLMIISAALAGILLTYPGKYSGKYTYGYAGPIDLKKKNNNHLSSRRIEPTLTADSKVQEQYAQFNSQENELTYKTVSNNPESFTTDNTENHQDIGELIRVKFLNHKHSKPLAILLVLVVISAIITSYILSVSNVNNQITSEVQPKTESLVSLRDNQVTLPDEFSLMTTQFEGLLINWQADESRNKALWDIKKAQGDSSCKAITFNNNEQIRTTSVVIEEMDEYYAEFSPLDTGVIIKNIAAKNSFTLCGYSFSLKGSQAALASHPYYAEKLAQ